MLADLVLAALAALLTVLFSRRLMRPFLAVAAALDRAGDGRFEPMPVPARDPEAGRLARAFNLMAGRLREREALAARLAGRERAAVLGRLAATLAHEVRNPLAGMLTALDTIRRFGAEAAIRGRALDLVERGLRQIEAVVRSTLASYRQDAEPQPITAEDLEDLQLLVQPEARRGGVRLRWRVALEAPFATDGQRLRQLLLNLLLNAVAATPRDGLVSLDVRREGEALLAELRDEAGGLPEAAWRRLEAGVAEAAAPGEGLGLPIAGELAAALGASIELAPNPGGSCIRLTVPPQPEPAA
ncbi:ATP-binding protein [Pseudoroseomonas cervicalis]